MRCITEYGIQSYLVKGVFSSKKKNLFSMAYFQPLSQLEMVVSHKNKGTLEYVKEVKVSYAYQTIYQDHIKNAIVFYLSELLSKSLRESTLDINMLEYITICLQWLDTHDEVSNFHLLFTLSLTRYIGFYPNSSKLEEAPYFDLIKGKFSFQKSRTYISGETLKDFKSLIHSTFDNINQLRLSVTRRRNLLDELIKYYQIHLDNFKKFNSIDILHQFFE